MSKIGVDEKAFRKGHSYLTLVNDLGEGPGDVRGRRAGAEQPGRLHTVARRTNEIGIRMALGGEGRDVMRMILGEAVKLLGVGLAVGSLLALAGARVAGSMLFGLRPSDPATFLLATATLAAIAVAAS